MSTLYLFNAHNNVLASSDIDGVSTKSNGVPINGSFVVKIPDGVRLVGDNPSTLANLLTQKYAGILALYPGFTHITYDEMTDATGWTMASQAGVAAGSRGTFSILAGGLAQTDMVGLAATPSEAIFLWEIFNYSEDNPAGGRFIRSWEERPSTEFTVTASFDNGANYTSVLDGTLQSIAPPVQGNQFILRLSNTSGSRRWLGSWAVIY